MDYYCDVSVEPKINNFKRNYYQTLKKNEI